MGIVLVAILFSSCAGAIPIEDCVINTPSGFWFGLWNGLTIEFSFIGSLFSGDIVIYDVNNSGGWYDFGFIIGLGSSTAIVKFLCN